jgi:small subunit ribosomal protein S2
MLTVIHIGRFALPKSPNPNACVWRRKLASTAIYSQEQQQSHRSPIPKNLPTDIRDPNHPVAQDFIFYHHQKAVTGRIGSDVAPHYRPNALVSNPPHPEDITLELLMASQTHIGHATSLWHPANAKYIFGVRGDHDPIHIISLDITAAYLRRACKIVESVTSRGGLVLFVGTREGQIRSVVRAAELSQGCHLFTKWIPGSITNGQQILGACAKKVVDENDISIPGFGDQLPQTSALKPDLVVCLNPLENYILLHECGMHNIPTIGIVDTDVNPTWVTYPIPANDDSLRSVQVICGALGRAGEKGQNIRRRRAQQGMVVSMPSHGLEPPTEGQAEKDLEEEAQARLAEAAIQEELTIEAEAAAAEEARLSAKRDAERAAREALDDAQLTAALEESSSIDTAMLDRTMKREQAMEEWEDEHFEPYERDRPLTQEELSQATGQVEQSDIDESVDTSRDREGPS